MGIVVTTTIMQTISQVGSAMTVDIPDAPTPMKGTLLLNDVHNPRIPALILGTSFVLGIGAMPQRLRASDEGSAMYIGVQYAYSDIILGLVPFPEVRRALSIIFIVAVPLLTKIYSEHTIMAKYNQGPSATLFSAVSFAGIAFVMDSIMPLSTGYMGEDVVRGVVAVMLVHTIMIPVSSLSNDVGSFSTWLVAR